jgi:geranylgeranyl diphosphate synthase type II
MTFHDAASVRTDVDRELKAYYERRCREARALDTAYGRLWDVMLRLESAGGKRLRPYLLVLAYEMYGGTAYEDILPVAAAHEILHQSLLIHDDITDKDMVRYGIDNVTGEYDKRYGALCVPETDVRHYAESAALLAGDLLLSDSHSMIMECGLTDAQRMAAHRIMSDAVFHVAAGQLLDMEAGMQEMRKTDPFKIAGLKTASYSFVAPLKCGAMLAGAPDSELQKLARLGQRLGEAYQLSDDLLSTFGDEAVTGKSNLTDLQEGKHTYLMQMTFRMTTPEQLDEVRKYYGRQDLDEDHADIIRGIMVACGARAAVESKLADYRHETVSAVDALKVPDAARSELHRLAGSVTRRER